MGLIASFQPARTTGAVDRRRIGWPILCTALCVTGVASIAAYGQAVSTAASMSDVSSALHVSSEKIRTRHFLGGRSLAGNGSAARAMDAARQQHATMRAQQNGLPQQSGLSAAWQPIGPNQVASIAY